MSNQCSSETSDNSLPNLEPVTPTEMNEYTEPNTAQASNKTQANPIPNYITLLEKIHRIAKKIREIRDKIRRKVWRWLHIKKFDTECPNDI